MIEHSREESRVGERGMTVEDRLLRIEQTLTRSTTLMEDTRDRLFGNGSPGSGELGQLREQIQEIGQEMVKRFARQDHMDHQLKSLEETTKDHDTRLGEFDKEKYKVAGIISGVTMVIMFLTGGGTISLHSVLSLLKAAGGVSGVGGPGVGGPGGGIGHGQ